MVPLFYYVRIKCGHGQLKCVFVNFLKEEACCFLMNRFFSVMLHRVLRLSLLYVRNHSIQHGFVDDTIHSALNSILAIFLDKWEIFKEEQRRREEEEGSLFKFRNKSHVSSLTEDEENKLAVSRAFPSFDEEFKDILAPEDLNDSRDTTRLNDEASQCLPSSNAELFMANMKDFSEIRRVHEEMFSRLPSSQDQSLGVTDCCLFGSVDAQFLEAFQWGYQTAALVNAIIPCKLFTSCDTSNTSECVLPVASLIELNAAEKC